MITAFRLVNAASNMYTLWNLAFSSSHISSSVSIAFPPSYLFLNCSRWTKGKVLVFTHLVHNIFFRSFSAPPLLFYYINFCSIPAHWRLLNYIFLSTGSVSISSPQHSSNSSFMIRFRCTACKSVIYFDCGIRFRGLYPKRNYVVLTSHHPCISSLG